MREHDPGPWPHERIAFIPLDRLELSPDNARRTPANDAAMAELKASIAAHGLLENLVVRPQGGDGEDARYAVIAGGRRLAAMKALAKDGALDAGFPVPCRVCGDSAMQRELSLAENTVRVAMHPADQVETFRRLADDGATAAEIAVRFGARVRTVEQRLRLGGAAPVLLDALRAGEIDLETLTAFVVTADQGRQTAVWDQVKGQGYRPTPWQVRRMLTEDRIPATSDLARFVGVEAYEAAGGAVDRDLFAEEDESGIWLDDPKLLRDLAMNKLAAAAEELRTRWRWAEARIEIDWGDTACFGRVHPQPGEATPEERAEIERLETRHDELVALDDGDWTDDLVVEAERIEERLDELHGAIKARAVYRREDLGLAGCIVTVGDGGDMQVVQGLVRSEDMPEREPGTANGAGSGSDPARTPGGRDAGYGEAGRIDAPAFSGPAAAPADLEAAARKEAGVGIGLADDLRAVRAGIVKARLACDFDAAFDLLLFQLAHAVFGTGYRDDALDVAVRPTPERPSMRANDENFLSINAGEKLLTIDRASLPLDWLDKPAAESFAELRRLPERKKRHLFASCVARTLRGQLAFEAGARPETEATVARLDIDFAATLHSNPAPALTAGLLWSRLRKDRLLAIAGATLGEAWAAAHAKSKKSEIAAALEAAFFAHGEVPAEVTAEGRAAALAWVPPGFAAFDAGGAEENDGAQTGAEEPDAPPMSGAADSADGTMAGKDGAGSGTDTPEPAAPTAVEPPANPAPASEVPERPVDDSPGSEDGGEPFDPGTPIVEVGNAGANGAGSADALPHHDAVRIVIEGGGGEVRVQPERMLAPATGNGRDAGEDLLKIPAFLRRAP